MKSEIFGWKAEIIVVEWLQVKRISHSGRKLHSLPRMTISINTHHLIGDVLPSLWQIYFCFSFSMRVHVNCSSLLSIGTIESNRSTDPDRSIARKQIQRTHGLRKKTCFIHTILGDRLTVIVRCTVYKIKSYANVITIERSFESTVNDKKKNCSYR